MFLFTSEDSLLDRYIREHWAALDGLSGESCDIHIPLLQLVGAEDFYSQLHEIRSIPGLESIKPTELPALHLWSEISSITIPLRAFDTETKLRDLLRSVFSTVRTVDGPISPESAEVLRSAAKAIAVGGPTAAHGQAVQESSAGRDIIQITVHNHGSSKENSMEDLPATRGNRGPQSAASGKPTAGQIIEDVDAGGKITQTTDSAADSQMIRRATTPGAVAQKKGAISEMAFGGGNAKGFGIIGLVVAILAWLAYKYLSGP